MTDALRSDRRVSKKFRGRWFRMYERILDNEKLWKLSDIDFRNWMLVLAIASNHAQDGRLPETSLVMSKLRLKPSAIDGSERHRDVSLDRLVNAGLLDRVNGGANGWAYAVHDWNEWQYKSDSSTDRQRLFRERHHNVPSDVSQNVTVTPRAPARSAEVFLLKEKPIDSSPRDETSSTAASLTEMEAKLRQKYPNEWIRGRHPWRDMWLQTLQAAIVSKKWMIGYHGPRPGQPGCFVPADILADNAVSDWKLDADEWEDWR